MEAEVNALQKLGLTLYQAKSLTALLLHGELNAYKIAKHSTVPISRVYNVMKQLETNGYVSAVNGRPKCYKAAEPEKIIELAATYHRKRFDEVTSQFDSILDTIKRNGDEDVLFGKEKIVETASALLSGCNKKMYALLSKEDSFLKFNPRFKSTFDTTLERVQESFVGKSKFFSVVVCDDTTMLLLPALHAKMERCAVIFRKSEPFEKLISNIQKLGKP